MSTTHWTGDVSHIAKFGFFDAYLARHFLEYAGYSGTQTPSVYDFSFKTPIAEDRLAEFQALVRDYVPPPYWLDLVRLEETPLVTHPVSSSEPVVSHTFINSSMSPDGAVMCSIKHVMRYSVSNVQAFADDDPEAAKGCRLVLYDLTRTRTIATAEVSLKGVIEELKAAAAAGATGTFLTWRSVQLEGLEFKMPNHDCIWQFLLAVDDPRVSISLNGFQKLYYNINDN